MNDETRFIGLVITLFLALIWFVFVAMWFFSPKQTCVSGPGIEDEICFNSTDEAKAYMDEQIEKQPKERKNPELYLGNYSFQEEFYPNNSS